MFSRLRLTLFPFLTFRTDFPSVSSIHTTLSSLQRSDRAPVPCPSLRKEIPIGQVLGAWRSFRQNDPSLLQAWSFSITTLFVGIVVGTTQLACPTNSLGTLRSTPSHSFISVFPHPTLPFHIIHHARIKTIGSKRQRLDGEHETTISLLPPSSSSERTRRQAGGKDRQGSHRPRRPQVGAAIPAPRAKRHAVKKQHEVGLRQASCRGKPLLPARRPCRLLQRQGASSGRR